MDKLNAWILSAPDLRDDSDNPMTAFFEAMKAGGLHPKFPIPTDIIVRVPDSDDTGSERAGWYIYFESQDDKGRTFAAGCYGSWRDNVKIPWSCKSVHSMSHDERITYNRLIEEAKVRAEIARAAAQSEAAEECRKIYSSLKPCPSNHPYFERKGVIVSPLIGVDENGNAIIPIVGCDGAVMSIQRIFPDGKKRFFAGGKTSGGFFRIPHAEHGAGLVAICEGVATGLSIHMATGAMVYCAMYASNIYAVASHVRSEHANDSVIICADDNSANKVNTGLKEAIRASDVCGFPVVSPTTPKDFNDMHLAEGLAAVKALTFPDAREKGEDNVIQFKRYEPKVFDVSKIPAPPQKGFVRDVYDYYRATAGNFEPGYAYQTAIAVASIALARNYSTPEQTYSSLFLLTVGATGTGKETIKKVMETVITDAGMSRLIGNDGYTSDSAVVSALVMRPRHIVFIDEFDKNIEASKGRNGNSLLMQANKKLTECWGRCDGTMRGLNYATTGLTKEKAKDLNDIKIENPAITLVGSCTPENFLANIGGKEVDDGFLNRYLIYFSDADEDIRRHKPRMAVPEAIQSWMLMVTGRAAEAGNADENPNERSKPIVLNFTDAAMEMQEEYQHELIKWNKQYKQFGLDKMSRRSNEIAMRLSLIFALSEDVAATVVTEEHMQRGIEWARFCLHSTADRMKRVIAGSDYESGKKQILEGIRSAGERGMHWSKMQKRPPFSKFKPRDLKEIIQSLIEADLVAEEFKAGSNGKGRPSRVYYAIEDEPNV